MTERQKPSFVMKPFPIFAEEIPNLIESYNKNLNDIPNEIACGQCVRTIHLQDITYEACQLPYRFLIDGVPGYQCYYCNVAILPDSLQSIVDSFIQAEIQRMESKPN